MPNLYSIKGCILDLQRSMGKVRQLGNGSPRQGLGKSIQRPANRRLEAEPQKLNNFCYQTTNFNSNFKHLHLDFMICFNGGTKTWMTRNAAILVAASPMRPAATRCAPLG